MRFPYLCLAVMAMLAVTSCSTKPSGKSTPITNPISEKFYADPSLVQDNGTYYIYATIDPWGADSLGVLVSDDFKDWKPTTLNWPTTKACSSATSGSSKVWAPSVVKAANGNYYMYVSVGSEVWVGTSKQPLGPWKNAKADNSPLIARDLFPDYHMIDAECFIDTDGQAYLYWGSGLNWVNGHCFVVKLKEDMVTFDGDIQDVTPPNYFEAPIMLKHNNTYYLMYSDGNVTKETYKVRYATGATPYGPWTEGTSSPILETTTDKSTVSPGHHTIFTKGQQTYILYHRHSKNSAQSTDLLRELCVDSLQFDANGTIRKITPKGIQAL